MIKQFLKYCWGCIFAICGLILTCIMLGLILVEAIANTVTIFTDHFYFKLLKFRRKTWGFNEKIHHKSL
jgi:hypothetical protein